MTNEEITRVKNLLSKLEPGYLPEPIFHQFTRLSVTGILELVPFRKSPTGEIEILVCQRSEDDPHWPGMLHTPGTVLRPTDSDDFSSALERVFGEINRIYQKDLVDQVDLVFHKVARGKELSVIFATQISDSKPEDIWVPVEEIEGRIVETQVGFVRSAIKRYIY